MVPHVRVGDTVVFLKRVHNRCGDVRLPGQTAVVIGLAGDRFIDVEWGLAEGHDSRPNRGQLHDVMVDLVRPGGA